MATDGGTERGAIAEFLIKRYSRIMSVLMTAFACFFFSGLISGAIWGGFSAEANDFSYGFLGVMLVAVLVIIARVRAGYDPPPELEEPELPVVENIESLRF